MLKCKAKALVGLVWLLFLLPTVVQGDIYYDAMRQAIGANYGAPDPNSDRVRTADDFYNSDSSLSWWTVWSGSGSISIVTDASVIHKVLKTATSSSSSLILKFPAQGSINSKKRYACLIMADDDTSDGYGFQVEYKMKMKIWGGLDSVDT